MPTLHLVRQSAFSTNDFGLCLDTSNIDDSIVFIDDGCYCISHPLFKQFDTGNNKGIRFYIIAEHAQARALPLNDTVKAITMNDLVKLTFDMDNSITWQ